MTDITLPYENESVASSFSLDITNANGRLSIVTEGLSAGTITVSVLSGSGTAYAVYPYTADMADEIDLKGRKVRVVGSGVTCNYLSLT